MNEYESIEKSSEYKFNDNAIRAILLNSVRISLSSY